MHVIETIILGLIQGLTEFIPVSSSGHLVLAQNFFSGASDHLFLEFINIGTMLALIAYFWKRIWGIILDVTVRRNFRLARNILITSIPAGIVGFAVSSFIENSAFFGSTVVVAMTLFVVGVMMIVLEKLPRLSETKDGETLSSVRALLIGLAQMLALIPGVSRSGSTIIAGRLSGLSPKEAAEYSFLASLPVMIGVTLKIFLKDSQYLSDHFGMLLLSNSIAFISGILAIGFLLRYLANHGLAIFGWYRVSLSAVLAVVILLQYNG